MTETVSPENHTRAAVARAISQSRIIQRPEQRGLLLILFTESLDVRFAVRIEEFLATFLPRRFEFWRCDVPVRPAFPGNGTKVLAEIFHGGPAEEPVAVIDLINDKTRLEHNHVGNHGIVQR